MGQRGDRQTGIPNNKKMEIERFMAQPIRRSFLSGIALMASLIILLATPPLPTIAEGTAADAGHPSLERPAQNACTDNNAPDPTAVEVTQVPIVVTSTTDDYFVLYVQHDADDDEWEIPVLVKLGEASATPLDENVEALQIERYRVEKYLVADPADVDGDCIDDITELNNLGTMNPVNPTGAVEPRDGAAALADKDAFDILSGSSAVKVVVVDPLGERPGVYFINTDTHIYHSSLLEAMGITGTAVAKARLTHHSGPIGPDGDTEVFTFWTIDSTTLKYAKRTYTLLAANLPLLNDNLALHLPNADLPAMQEELPLYRESRIDLVFDDDIHPENFLTLNEGEGYGRLRALEADERPHPRDVVIYETLPSELPRVAGIISTTLQTPLSHVNLRAVQDQIPNAFIRGALDDTSVNSLVGSYVHYSVTDDGWSLAAATKEQVDSHYASSRPASKQTPVRDLSVTTITPLGGIGFNDWTAFGVKAANVAVMRTLEFPEGTVPDGFAIPFYFYEEFMEHNELYAEVTEMLADEDFQTDYEEQEDQLRDLRKAIKKADTPEWIKTALTEMHGSFPEGASLRYRSSTNNEDLPNFNGAGLYDSKTQHPEETGEDGIDKSFKQVLAGLWTFRAFTEREFHRIDHLATAMGVLVHPNYSDELANGVAVSLDLTTGRNDLYYVNTQLGEDLVTLPQPHSVPEELLISKGGRWYVQATSNLVEPGTLLMSGDQIDQLRQRLTTIHERFEALYRPQASDPFAMEIEFKITSDNILAIKQARPWVFSGTSSRTPAQPPTITTTGDPSPYPENGTGTVSTFQARDPEDRPVSWTVTGTDRHAFEISSNGVLTFSDPPDFENPTDSNRDSRYEIAVVAINDLSLTGRMTVTVTVTNDAADDVPQVMVQFGAASYAVAEGGTQMVTVTLSAAPERTVVIPIETANQGGATAADYSAVPQSVTFNSGDTSQTFTLDADADNENDDDESVLLSFGTMPDAQVNPGSPDETIVSITDDDDPTVTVMFGQSSYTVPEGSTQTVTVTMSADPERTVVIPIGKTNQGGATTDDYSDLPQSVTFIPGQTSATFTFTATDDTDNDDNESVLLSFGTLTTGVSVGTPNESTVSITDDDPSVDDDLGVSEVSVDGAELTITFDEALDAGQTPDGSTFAVTVAGSDRGVDTVAVSGSEVSLTLVTAVSAGDAVTVDYMAPTDEAGARLQDEAGNIAASFSGQNASNSTQPANRLTAVASATPDSHDGSSTFTFELRFSEEPADGFSYKTLRDHAFIKAGGDVVKARRLAPPSNIGWEVHVTPHSDGAVTIALPVTADCTAREAICTDDRRPLSQRLEVTVPEPGQPQPNAEATGRPLITGTTQVGDLLTATTPDIQDADGLQNVVFTHQWLADDAALAGATSSTHTLTGDHLGRAIRVRVTFTDDRGNEESLTSAATVAVVTAAPEFQSATVNGATLTLAYDEELDNGNTLSSGLFAVNVNGASRSFFGVAVDQTNVILLLSPAVEAGDAVTVDYTVPTDEEEGRVQDTSGNAAESFSVQSVTNDTAPPEAPLIPNDLQVTRHESGQLLASWTAPDSDPDPTGYTLQWKESSDDWADQDDVSQVDITGVSHIVAGLTDGTEYAVRVIATTDDAESEPSGEVTATPRETTPPELSSVSVDGATLTLTFDEPLDASDAADRSAFAVTVAGSSRGVDTVAVSGSVVALTLVTAASAGDAVTVDYTAPSGDSASRLKDLAGNAAASFSGQDVTNDTQAAVQLTASAHDVPAAHDGSATFTFELRFSEEPADGFSYKTLRDHAFTVTGGEVVQARRLEAGKNVRWEISVTPDGNGAVTIVLPVTTDCDASGAVCTEDGRKLSNRLELTVPGPGG